MICLTMMNILLLALIIVNISAYQLGNNRGISRISQLSRSQTQLFSVDEMPEVDKKTEDIEETTKKFGFEFGLWKSLTNKDANVKPGDLLKKYGVAYLATSISFAIVSYALCYLLVLNGIDVSALLEKVGIKATTVASNAGTAGIAYAIHKAASPIRFAPTVALTPVVAEWLGKKPNEVDVPKDA